MSKQELRLYEGMYILNASLSEDALKKALERITKTIEESGGEIHKIHEMGRKKLAYEIDGHKQGQYFLLYFSVNPTLLEEMWKEYHLNEDLIRYVTMRAEKVLEKIEHKPLVEA
ncbi:MAG: 30S ribosomal protein S6 [Chlamydiales bacterium]|nr:30S ribosomal protein S6 [Chlamydiales bacterium]